METIDTFDTEELCALRAKAYGFKLKDNRETKTPRGITKTTVEKLTKF